MYRLRNFVQDLVSFVPLSILSIENLLFNFIVQAGE